MYVRVSAKKPVSSCSSACRTTARSATKVESTCTLNHPGKCSHAQPTLILGAPPRQFDPDEVALSNAGPFFSSCCSPSRPLADAGIASTASISIVDDTACSAGTGASAGVLDDASAVSLSTGSFGLLHEFAVESSFDEGTALCSVLSVRSGCSGVSATGTVGCVPEEERSHCARGTAGGGCSASKYGGMLTPLSQSWAVNEGRPPT